MNQTLAAILAHIRELNPNYKISKPRKGRRSHQITNKTTGNKINIYLKETTLVINLRTYSPIARVDLTHPDSLDQIEEILHQFSHYP
jgi:hypothetical protein